MLKFKEISFNTELIKKVLRSVSEIWIASRSPNCRCSSRCDDWSSALLHGNNQKTEPIDDINNNCIEQTKNLCIKGVIGWLRSPTTTDQELPNVTRKQISTRDLCRNQIYQEDLFNDVNYKFHKRSHKSGNKSRTHGDVVLRIEITKTEQTKNQTNQRIKTWAIRGIFLQQRT